MSAIIAALLGSFLGFTTPASAPVSAYNYNGTLATHSTVTSGEHLLHGGKAYQVSNVSRNGNLTMFRTVPVLAQTGEVTFYPQS